MNPPKKSRRGVMLHAVIFLFFILRPPFASAAEIPQAPSLSAKVQTYDQLVTAIRRARTASRARLEQAVRREKVREAWETGKLIDEHVLRHKERADYDKEVMPRLAKDLATSERELYYMLEFARSYPILPRAAELSWSDYRDLLSLNDPKEREAVARQAVREGWSRNRLREEVRRRKATFIKGTKSLQAFKPGKPYTYRVVVAADGPYKNEMTLNLGFSNYLRPEIFRVKIFRVFA